MLKLNKTKTKFCITGTKSQVASVKDIKIRINDETIQNDTQVKILGFLFNSSNTRHNQINETIKVINYRMNQLRQVRKYTTEATQII